MKRAKRVKITYREVIRKISSYLCPHCGTHIVGAGIEKHITRFKCTHCGNECIVDND